MAENLKDPGSGIVVRGLLMFGFMVLLVVGGFFLLFRRPAQVVPAALVPAERLAVRIVQPVSAFPGTIHWAMLEEFSDALPSAPGWEIRYTAARNLARRGSGQVPWAIFLELLDENRQFRNFRVQLKDGRVVPDEASARQIVLSGLKALAEWHKAQPAGKIAPSAELLQVYDKVDHLTQSPIAEIKKQAEITRGHFPPKNPEPGTK